MCIKKGNLFNHFFAELKPLCVGILALPSGALLGFDFDDRNDSLRVEFTSHVVVCRADVVLLCYSVAMPRSLSNLKKVWIPEIRRRAPTTPVVIVGCQADLRYLYRDEHYQKIEKGLMYK